MLDDLANNHGTDQANTEGTNNPRPAVSRSEEKDGQNGLIAMNYMVEVFLDENNYVRRTRVYHVQSGTEAAWDNWNETKLLTYFKRRPELRLNKLLQPARHAQPVQTEVVRMAGTKTRPAVGTASSSATTVASGSKAAALSRWAGKPRLRKLEIIPALSIFPCRTVDHNQSFTVRLHLDLAGMKPSGQSSFNYTVAVLAKRLGGERHQEFLKGQGKINANSNMTVDLKWSTMPPGVYRLSAALTLNPEDADSSPQNELTASFEGGLFEVQ